MPRLRAAINVVVTTDHDVQQPEERVHSVGHWVRPPPPEHLGQLVLVRGQPPPVGDL